MVKHIDLDIQKKIVPELDSALRRGAGFATRVAVADAVTSLCSSCPNAFAFPGVSTSNPSVRLFRALYFASERERGAASKDRLTHALGSLAELVPGKAVRGLAAKVGAFHISTTDSNLIADPFLSQACERYTESSGSNNDPSVRKAAASTVRAIVVRATSQMQEGGSADVWAKTVLPTAFIGRHDEDSKISSLWNEVWEEGGASIKTRDNVFGALLQEKLLPDLMINIIIALRSTSWSNRLGACKVISELTNASILAPIPRSTNGISDGSKERFNKRATASCAILFECVKMIARSNRIWAGKGEVVKAAISIAGKWAGMAPLNAEYCHSLPLVINSDSQDDLFVGDLWFKSAENEITQEQSILQEYNCVEEKVTGDENINLDSDTALDLTDEPNFDEEGYSTKNQFVADETETSTPLTYFGLCRLLCDQGLRVSKNEFTEGVLPYKAAALGGLSNFLRAVVASQNSEKYDKIRHQQQLVYNMLAPRLYNFIAEARNGAPAPPLLVAKSLECLASAFYHNISDDQSFVHSNPLAMLKFLAECSGASQPAWTVRQSGVLAASRLVSNMSSDSLCKNDTIITILNCSSHALKDRKFWKVR